MAYKAADGENSLIDDGTYKATVETVEEKDNFDKSAKRLVIMWDLSNGRKFFDGISKDKDGSGDYNHYRIGLILYALRVDEVSTTQDLLTKLNGKSCKMTITHQYSDKKGADYNSVKSYDIDLESEAKEDKKNDDSKNAIDANDMPF